MVLLKRFFLLLFFGTTCNSLIASSPPEIWIARRADSRSGTGSKNDPYDGGSSDLLDPILRKALDVPGMTVHLGPGQFLTKSVLAKDPVCFRQTNLSLVGAGMYRTILALDPAVSASLPGWAFSVLQTAQQINPESHLTVQDLTVDTNWPKLVKPRQDVSVGNVSLIGSYCSIIRVRGINSHGDQASGKECFGIGIGCGGPYDIHDGLISDCVVELPSGDYVNGITLAGWTFNVYPATNATGIIRGCKVYNMRADHKHAAAFGVAGGVIADCYAENSTIGVYMECANDLTISNCVFLNNTWRGVWVCPANDYGGIHNLRVLSSTIEASNFIDGAACIEVGNGDQKNLTANALINGNIFRRKNVKQNHQAYSVISTLGISNLAVMGNKIDRTLNQSLIRGATTLGNCSLDNSYLPALPDVLASEGETRFLQPRPRSR